MFVARPPAKPALDHDLCLVRAVRRSFTGPAEFLADPANRARVAEYLADMVRPYDLEVPASSFGEPPSPDLGQSYGEMAEALINSAVSPDEPVDLLILAFSVHDLWPGRQTAAYLSHLTPGAPMAFALCDQGSAAAFSGLRIAREYASSAAIRRALLIVVEQAALPYSSTAPLPLQHRAVAMLFADSAIPQAPAKPQPSAMPQAPAMPQPSAMPQAPAMPQARVAALRQHAGVPPGDAADLAAADLADLSVGYHQAGLVLGADLAALWAAPAAKQVHVMPPGQPSTGVWWGLIDELTPDAGQPRLDTGQPDSLDTGQPDLLVLADYDPGLRYLCLTAFGT